MNALKKSALSPGSAGLKRIGKICLSFLRCMHVLVYISLQNFNRLRNRCVNMKICLPFSLNSILFEASGAFYTIKITGLVVCVLGTAVLSSLFENLRALVINSCDSP